MGVPSSVDVINFVPEFLFKFSSFFSVDVKLRFLHFDYSHVVGDAKFHRSHFVRQPSIFQIFNQNLCFIRSGLRYGSVRQKGKTVEVSIAKY